MPKYHIDTIPVWDALKSGGECPLCVLEEKAENQYVEFYLGDSVMEPDNRIEVNENGFCRRHYGMLYQNAGNKLPLALMAQTISQRVTERLSDMAPQAAEKRRLFAKSSGAQDAIAYIDEVLSSCVICDKLGESMKRYIYTMLHLWEHDAKFKDELMQSKGFCLRHFRDVLVMAQENMAAKAADEFIQAVWPLQISNMQRVQADIDWFIDKYDYRNQDKPWGTSKDALPRMLQKLAGRL